MMNKVKKNICFLKYLPQIMYFNFKMLPFKYAIRLPIWLYKPKFLCLEGGVVFDCLEKDIKPGMIKLGENNVSIYPNSGIMLEIYGKLRFKGNCYIGNNSYISVGKKGELQFGKTFSSTTSLKLVCNNSVIFGDHVLVGWDCLIMDTDFHTLTRIDGSKNLGYGPIYVEDEVWIANGCKIFKNSTIPYRCVVSSGSIISGKIDVPECSVIGNNNQIIVKQKGVYLDYKDNKIE